MIEKKEEKKESLFFSIRKSNPCETSCKIKIIRKQL